MRRLAQEDRLCRGLEVHIVCTHTRESLRARLLTFYPLADGETRVKKNRRDDTRGKMGGFYARVQTKRGRVGVCVRGCLWVCVCVLTDGLERGR